MWAKTGGGKQYDRIRRGWNGGVFFSTGYGLCCFLLMLILAEPLANLFSDKPAVITVMVDYLRIIMLSACFVHASAYSSFGFNAVGKPGTAWVLNLIRMICLTLPGAYFGGRFFGLNGIFWGGGLSGSLGGFIGWFIFNRMLNKTEHEQSQTDSE